eukprot:1761928-Amphidinium_carterae.1
MGIVHCNLLTEKHIWLRGNSLSKSHTQRETPLDSPPLHSVVLAPSSSSLPKELSPSIALNSS